MFTALTVVSIVSSLVNIIFSGLLITHIDDFSATKPFFITLITLLISFITTLIIETGSKNKSYMRKCL